MGPGVGGSGVSGNSIGRATSVIQFDDITAMVAMHLHIGSREGSTEKLWILPALLSGRDPSLWPSLQQLSVPL